MKKQPGLFRWICIVIAAILLVVSLSVTAVSAALFFKGQRIEDMKTEATVRLVFSETLSGEDPALVESLENIPAFKEAQTRYTYALLDWRYSDGEDWSGLSDDETRAISHELLYATLENDAAVAANNLSSNPDFEDVIEEHEKALMNPMQNLFPSFKGVLTPYLIRHLDAAASILTGRVFIISAFISLVFLAVLFLFCRGFAEHSMPIALTLIIAAAVAFIFAVRVDFLDAIARIYPDYALIRRPSDSVTGFLAIVAFSYLVLSIPFVVLSIKHFASAPAAEEPFTEADHPAALPVYKLSPDEGDYQYGDAEPSVPAFLSKPAGPAVPSVADLPRVEPEQVEAAVQEKNPEPEPAADVPEPVSEKTPAVSEPAQEPVSEETVKPESEPVSAKETAESAEPEEDTVSEETPAVSEEVVISSPEEEPVSAKDAEPSDKSSPDEESASEEPDDPAEEPEDVSSPDIPEETADTEERIDEEFFLPDSPEEDAVPAENNAPDDTASAEEAPEGPAPETSAEPVVEDAPPVSDTVAEENVPAAEQEAPLPDDFYMQPGPLYGKAHSLSALEADASYDDGDFMNDLPLL